MFGCVRRFFQLIHNLLDFDEFNAVLLFFKKPGDEKFINIICPVFYVMHLVAICAQLIRTLAECLQFIHGLADEGRFLLNHMSQLFPLVRNRMRIIDSDTLGTAVYSINHIIHARSQVTGDFSNESFALIIALLMPATVDWYVVIMAVLAGVLIGKEVFGGYGSYPFNPAAVGYAVAAVSWPEQVFRYPQPYTNIPLWDATGVPVSSTISDTLRSGGSLNISAISLVLGEYAAPMGTGAALILLACGLFLWLQKDVRLSASVSFVVTCALIAFLFPRQVGVNGVDIALRLQCVRDELLTGAMLFSAVFLLNEPYTCAHHHLGRILYGVLVGAITMGFRYYGVYETGVCFALLTVNSISGWMDRTESRLYQLMHRPAAGKEGAE